MATELGLNISRQRMELGLSQEALANKLGISRQAVSRWERGEALPDTENLIALADLFGMSLDELVRPKAEEAAQAEAPEAEVNEAKAGAETDEAETETETAEPEPATAVLEPEATAGEPEQPTIERPAIPAAPTAAAAAAPQHGWSPLRIALTVIGVLLVSRILLGFLLGLGGFALYSFLPRDAGAEAVTQMDPVAAGSVDQSEFDILADGVTDIELIWPAGDVSVVAMPESEMPGGAGTIHIAQTRFDGSSEDGLVWKLVGDGLLCISCDPDAEYIGEVALEVLVPYEILGQLDSVSLEVLDGSLYATDLSAGSLSAAVRSGAMHLDGLSAESLSFEQGTGQAEVRGRFGTAEARISGGADAWLEVENDDIESIDAEVTTGELMLLLPADAGFTLAQHSDGRGTVDSSFDLVYDAEGGHVGDGSIDIELALGDGHVTIDPIG